MKKFTILCISEGESDSDRRKLPFLIEIGEPCAKRHPLYYQARLLSTKKVTIPQEVMNDFQKLHQIAKENDISFEELCAYVLGTASSSDAPES